MLKEYKINTEIYSENIVKEAIKDFEDVSDIKFDNNIISIDEDDSDIVFNELMNYVVGLINE